MSSPTTLNNALLKPAILQILRAVGYHSAKPSVVEALTDLTARYMILLASQTSAWAQENHQSPTPDITDVRLALTDVGMLGPNTQASEEVWREILRKPIESIPDRNGLRAMEASRRNDEDTEDVQQFVTWFSGRICEEIQRISGLAQEKAQTQTQVNQPVQAGEKGQTLEATTELDDYLTALKKKHSKTGEESRFQGTVLGIGASSKTVKVEGGPASINDWVALLKDKRQAPLDTENTAGKDSQDVQMGEG